MSDRFIQLHLLTFYGPANLNRDDTGRPKTAIIGGTERLRISSQSLKHAVRTSDAFQETLHGHLAQRTQRLGDDIERHLIAMQLAADRARNLAGAFVAPIRGENLLAASRDELTAYRDKLTTAYSDNNPSPFIMDVRSGQDPPQ